MTRGWGGHILQGRRSCWRQCRRLRFSARADMRRTRDPGLAAALAHLLPATRRPFSPRSASVARLQVACPS
jgi:hypothetical protein